MEDIVAYGENYNLAMEGIREMVLGVENPMASFKQSAYPDAFEAYLNKNLPNLNAIEYVYQAEETDEAKKAWLEKLVQYLIDGVQEELSPIEKKSKREEKLLNFNLVLAIFTFPSLLGQEGDAMKPLSEVIVENWNRTFKTNVGCATYEAIEQGFHKKLCYITTAVCGSQGKPDDCYELELLRGYRDDYLMATDEGEALVKEYYDIAPTIVKRIGRRADADTVYEGLWEQYISSCIQMIEQGRMEDCQKRYVDMVQDLKSQYLS